MIALVLALCTTSTAPAYDSAFWQAWGDGQAEIDGYALTRMRYGEKRTGTVVVIFVTEPWSVSGHVKAEKEHPKTDVVQVLKQNTVEDFQTGIYDYNLMTSAWTALEDHPSLPKGTAPKIAFSAQEWCGTTYTDVVFDGPGKSGSEIVRSYFDGESGMHTLDNKLGLVEDSLLVWARGLASPLVHAGESVEVPFLPSLAHARLSHTPLAWTTAKLTRISGAADIVVPAGKIACERATVVIAGPEPRSLELCVESAAPHRIVKMTSTDGYQIELTGTVRTPYWQKHQEGDEAMLTALGLKPPRSR